MVKRFLFSMIFVMAGLFSFAQYSVQSKYFVYLQTEPAQPFYIRINGQQLSANISGYLILPQLKDGNYKLIVGFPQNKYPEQAYNFRIDSKDKGYLIKDFGGTEGWGLFDLQTMAVQKPLTPEAINQAVVVQKPVSAPPPAEPKENVSDFTKVLSKAANDPGLLEKPKESAKPVVPENSKPVIEGKKEEVAMPEPSKEKPVEKVVEGLVSSAPQDNAQTVEPKPLKPSATQPIPAITASSDVTTSAGRGTGGVMITYDNVNDKGQAEPVTIFIPEPATVASMPVQLPAAEPQRKDSGSDVIPKIIDTQSKPSFEVVEKPAMPEQAKEPAAEVVKTNAACKKVADEDDFLKLRRDMAQKDNDDAMISQAKTAFKKKCYTTAHIKYLSSMFLSNAGKYNFYEAARPYVADLENFSSLRSEIKDDYYLGKFDALAGQ